MPSMKRNQDKGREAENATARRLNERGFDLAERRRQAGVNDRGDISGVRGWTFEVKWGGEKLSIPEWLRELDVEQANTGDPYGLLVVRPRGVPDPAKFWAIQRFDNAIDLIHLTQGVKYTTSNRGDDG